MSPSTTTLSLARDPLQQAELKFLESSLDQLFRDIQNLESRKIEYLRRLNDMQTPTAILPPEVLCVVFEHACSDTNLLPVTLGAVSAHWRAVAWTWPKLWTSLSLSLKVGEKDVPERYLALIRLYFSNIHHLSLSLELRNISIVPFSASRWSPGLPRTQFIDFILHENSSKLRSFTCTGMDNKWWNDICRSAEPTQLPHLESINFEWSEAIRRSTTTPFLTPKLTSASLSGWTIPTELPWKQLTRLQLFKISADTAIDLLLEEYHCSVRQWVDPARSRFSHLLRISEVTLPRLRELGWWFQGDGWDDFILKSVRFPSLVELHSVSNGRPRVFIDPFPPDFISHAPQLQVFHGDIKHIWRGPGMNGYTTDIQDQCVAEGVSGILGVTKLQELYLNPINADGLRFLFDHLTFCHDCGHQELAPRLQILSLHSDTLHRDLFTPEIFASFVRFLTSRRVGAKLDSEECLMLERLRLSSLESLELPKDASMELRVEFTNLRELIRGGLQVDLGISA